MRPRVWFGERWITSIFDLFEENVRYFPALLPITEDEDPLEVLEAGGTPELRELRLHNGTIYRWNRPVYDIAAGVPAPARREPGARRRARPSSTRWPTPRSTSAWSARWPRASGRCGRRCRSAPPRRTSTSPPEHGIDAQIYWPGVGQVRATELVLRRLLPLAHEGLDAWGVAAEERDRLLGIIEQRCLTGTNGAEWFVGRMHQRARPRTATTRCGRRCWSTASRCTPTSRCTPGSSSRQGPCGAIARA